jgi:hypothetical protein
MITISAKASFTLSSLKGLIIASIFFMIPPLYTCIRP